MKKFLIAGSSLAAVGAAGAAGAVDVTLGGSIDMGVEFGVGKNQGSLSIGDAYNSISLSLSAAGTTDAGLRYGGSFALATAAEIEFDAYGEDHKIFKFTVKDHTDLQAAAYNVSGGQKLDPDEIVGVKINSDWHMVSEGTLTEFGYPIRVSNVFSPIDADAICKVAGRAATGTVHSGLADSAAAPDGGLAFARASALGNVITDLAYVGIAGSTNVARDGYLPAGRVTQIETSAETPPADAGGRNGLDATLVLTAGTSNVQSGNVVVWADAGDNFADAAKDAADALDDEFNVAIADLDSNGSWVPGKADDGGVEVVTNATVFAGPYAEVRMQSSTTKMVVGAVCVTGRETSETAIFMDNVTKIVTATDASIYIEGGFGRLTLQTGDYAGAVSAIGDAGDQADIHANGLVVIAEGVGLLGANPYLAVDLAPSTDTFVSSLNSLEVLTGGTIDMGGLSAAVDIELDNADGVIGIGSWDLGLSYAMGDMAVDFVVDSANAWGMSASMDVAGFGVDATIYNKAAEPHKKSGLFYDVSASTSLNGFGLSLGVDQDLQPTVSLSKSMGGLSIYAGYDAGEEGGQVGATLSF